MADTKDPIDKAADQRTDDDTPEVEGHITSLLDPELATNKTRDRLAQAEQARRSEGVHHSRDGGLLDKLFRRKTKP